MITKKTARKLKELGFPQTAKAHYYTTSSLAEDYENDEQWRYSGYPPDKRDLAIPNTDELLAQLPHEANGCALEITKVKSDKGIWGYRILYNVADPFVGWGGIWNESLSEALAEMWILLKQKGVIK